MAAHQFKYLTDDPLHTPEAGYTVEEGVVVDPLSDLRRSTREENRQREDAFTRFAPRSKTDLLAEEAAWAARSGPVTVRRATA